VIWKTLCYLLISVTLACAQGGCAGQNRTENPAAPSVSAQAARKRDEGKPLLVDTARIATSAGAGPLTILGFGAGVAGDSIDAFASIPPSRCALIFARATNSVQDLDLALYTDDGTELATDEAADDLPTLIICPKSQERVFISARIAQGKGLVALGLQDLSNHDTEMVQRAVGARGLTLPPQEVDEGWPGLNAAIQSHRRSLGGNWNDLRRVALPIDSRVPTRIGAVVPKESCLDVLLLPGESVGGLGLVAIDREERVFARSREAGHERHLLFCAEAEEQPISLEVHPRVGRGLSVMILSSLTDPTDRLALSHDAEVIRLGAQGAQISPPRPRHGNLKLIPGSVVSFLFHSEGCSRLDLLPEENLVGIDARVWDREGQLVGHSISAYSAPVFVCAKGELRLDLEARERAGSVSIYVTPVPDPPGELLQSPLAASRLLTGLDARGLSSLPKKGQVEKVDLVAERIVRRILTISAASCGLVLAAKDASGGSLELRIFDERKGVELGDARGLESVSAQICATNGSPLGVVMELRISQGSGSALWAIQHLPN
jgi:hypothetical protein